MSRKPKPIPPEIVDYLDYNPETGILIWKRRTPNNNRIKIGQEAGTTNNHGYRQILFKRILYSSHRLAYFLYHGVDPKEKQIDHIDGNPLNNKINNLRLATYSQNGRNRGLQKNNKSGVVGVSWHTRSKKWRVFINANNKSLHLGSFDDMEEAIAVRIAAEKKYFGEFRNNCNDR